jgi:hypothetical protein
MKMAFNLSRLRNMVSEPLASRPMFAHLARGMRRATPPNWKLLSRTANQEMELDLGSQWLGCLGDIQSRKRLRLLLLAPDTHPDTRKFRAAMGSLGITFQQLDVFSAQFVEDLSASEFDFVYARPGVYTKFERQVFWEAIQLVEQLFPERVYPSLKELRIYESKREMISFMKAWGVPHPESVVAFSPRAALEFSERAGFPLIFKTTTSSGASGVEVIGHLHQLKRLVKLAFGAGYLNRTLLDPRDIDFDYVILQEFLSDVREFRVIQLGESWFAHEKLPSRENGLMSGSGEHAWSLPPEDLLWFCKSISDEHQFESMCFDVFVSVDGQFLVNELQTWFGSNLESQMFVDGIPGRFVFRGNEIKFEEGLFNSAGGHVLRVEHLARKLLTAGD